MKIKVNNTFHVSTHEVIKTAINRVLIDPNKTDKICEPKSGITLDGGHTCWYSPYGLTVELENISREELRRWQQFIHDVKPLLNQALKDEFEKGKREGTNLLVRLNKGEVTLKDIEF